MLLAGVAPAHAAESVLVNANADGDTPIAGGVVRASACARPTARRGPAAGSRLRQSNGALEEPTNAAGVAFLDFDRLPDCLIVEVSGGQANGTTLPGAFRAQAHNHTGEITTVLATPVSTLRYDAMRARPSLSRDEATRLVDRLLGIPTIFDDIDLAADDGPFDGDRYLADVSRAGSVASFDAALLRSDRPRPIRGHDAVARAVNEDLAKWWKDLDVTKMVKDGLKDFGLSIITGGLESGGKWVLGRLLDYWGLKAVKDFLLPKSDTEKIIEMLQELTIRVNNLQRTSDAILKEVAGINYQQTVQPAIDLISTIKTVQQDIVGLLALNDDDPGRVGATKDILNLIETQIAPKRGLINELMLETGPGGDGILRAASKKAALQDRWFTAEDSQAVTDVYNYFAMYQLRMANLLTEYWNTRSCTSTPVPADCLSPTTIQQRLGQFQTDIDAQAALLKPPLPPGTFIDRNTMRMWPTASWPLNGQDALNWTSYWRPRRCTTSGLKRRCTGSAEGTGLPRRTNLTLPALGPWADWQTPTEDDFKSLIDGWEGDSPLAWLNKNVGFRTTTMTPQNDKDRLSGHMWFRDSFRPGAYLYVYRVNLSEPDRPGPHVWYKSANMPSGPETCSGLTCTEDLSTIDFSDIRTNYTAQMVLWRPVQPGDYWWP